MKRKSSQILKAVPILYALIMLFFLFYHFSRFEDISLVVQNVSYKGSRTIESRLTPASIRNLSVFTNGLKIDFSKSKKLQLITDDNIVRELAVQDLEVIDDGLILYFKYDISLKFTSLNSDSTIVVSVPQTIPPVKEIVLDFSTQKSFLISRDDQLRIMLSDGTSTYFLDGSSTFDYDDKYLRISMEDRILSTLTLKDEAPGLGRTSFEWLADRDKIVPDRTAAINEFRDKAYKGWTQRFDRNTGNLKMPEGMPAFSERALVYYLSEMYNRAEHSLYAADILKASDKQSSELSWYSSAFTGDVVNRTAALLRTSPTNLLKEKNSLLMKQDYEASPFKEINELGTILDNPESNDPVSWIEQNIYPLIVWLEEGLYIFHPETPEVDTVYTLLAADLLEKASGLEGNQDLLDLSAALRDSILSRAEADGTLPEKISFSRERASLEIGKIPAEAVFALFGTDQFSPRIIDLSSRISQGSWLFTSAGDASVRKTDESIEIDVSFPVGQIHHFVIKGVEPFDRIFLHNIRWKSDPRFQRYSDGWVYNSVNKTLYVKIKHRSAKETVRILFEPAEVIPAVIPEVNESPADTTGSAGENTENTAAVQAAAE